MRDAEAELRGAKRPLVLGMGGGGDVVGALATAEFSRIYDGTEPILGGLAWERRPIDPRPGPRKQTEIEATQALAPAVLLASPQTRVRGTEIYFAESRMAQFLGQPTLLVDVLGGPGAIAAGLLEAIDRLRSDLVVFIDVGGDVLAQGGEPGLRSPLCDAVMLAVAAQLSETGHRVLAGIFGIGCDAELTPGEVMAQLARVAGAGGLCGARGLTDPVATRLENAIAMVPTEASAQAVLAFRGGSGIKAIRGGRRTLELSSIAALTIYLDPDVTMRTSGRLARAVGDANSLEDANERLHELGLRTELDLERDMEGVAT